MPTQATRIAMTLVYKCWYLRPKSARSALSNFLSSPNDLKEEMPVIRPPQITEKLKIPEESTTADWLRVE